MIRAAPPRLVSSASAGSPTGRAPPHPARCGRRDAPPRGRRHPPPRRPGWPPHWSGRARARVSGTKPDSVMSKPPSPIRQVIWSAASGTSAAWKPSIARPCGSAVTSAALQPSANSRKHSNCSISLLGCRCRRAEFEVQHQHPRLRLAADHVVGQLQRVDRRLAAHEADHAALHMAGDAVAPDNQWSSPGAAKPVQVARIRWVIPAASAARPSASQAASARAGASASKRAMRAAVLGKRSSR